MIPALQHQWYSYYNSAAHKINIVLLLAFVFSKEQITSHLMTMSA